MAEDILPEVDSVWNAEAIVVKNDDDGNSIISLADG
jgi:hypothetical protein